jgi:hypothetical protein
MHIAAAAMAAFLSLICIWWTVQYVLRRAGKRR